MKGTREEIRQLNVIYDFLLQAILGSKRVSIQEITKEGSKQSLFRNNLYHSSLDDDKS